MFSCENSDNFEFSKSSCLHFSGIMPLHISLYQKPHKTSNLGLIWGFFFHISVLFPLIKSQNEENQSNDKKNEKVKEGCKKMPLNKDIWRRWAKGG